MHSYICPRTPQRVCLYYIIRHIYKFCRTYTQFSRAHTYNRRWIKYNILNSILHRTHSQLSYACVTRQHMLHPHRAPRTYIFAPRTYTFICANYIYAGWVYNYQLRVARYITRSLHIQMRVHSLHFFLLRRCICSGKFWKENVYTCRKISKFYE